MATEQEKMYPGMPTDQGHQQPPVGGPPPPVVMMQPAMAVVFRELPLEIDCPSCRARVVTQTQFTTGMLTWLLFVILLFLGPYCCLCFIPFCVDGCKDVDHYCPSCHAVVGTYKRIG